MNVLLIRRLCLVLLILPVGLTRAQTMELPWDTEEEPAPRSSQTSASTTPDPKPQSDTPLSLAIQPRTEDAKWVYISWWFEDGEKVRGGIVNEEVVETMMLEGKRCFNIKTTFDFRTPEEMSNGKELTKDNWFFNWEMLDEQGSYNFDVPEGDETARPGRLSDLELTLPYPVEKGHTHEAEDKAWVVLDTARKVTVAAGSFECVVYQCEFIEGEEEDWYQNRLYMAPGVGLVKYDYLHRKKGQWVLYASDELVRTTLDIQKEEALEPLGRLRRPYLSKPRESAQKIACINNLRILQGGSDMWAIENNMPGDARPTRADLKDYLDDFPVCPQGGEYDLGTVNEPVSCSVHGVLP